MIYDCIIVGAGAAGLFAGAVFGKPVNGLILEKTRRAGTKLLMSGGGQCNITHSGSIKDFIPRYGDNGRKIRSCLYKYNNQHLEDFLQQNGIPTTTREDGKVFPKSMDARDIQKMLLQKAEQNGCRVRHGAEVTAIRQVPASPPFWQVDTPAGQFSARYLLIASGGCSYPTTGSDGSLFKTLQRDLQLDIVTPKPALTPVNVDSYPYSSQSGISFEKVQLQLWRKPEDAADYKKIGVTEGPLLLTHENFSGPLILNFSKYISKNDKIVLNYLYPSKKSEVLEKINRAFSRSKMQPANLLAKELQLPKSFAVAVVERVGAKPKAIAEALTEDTFTVSHLTGYRKAMVTAGGVSLAEMDCKTMEVKKHPQLYIIGEALDIDGETGGYNLQFAYASACAAAAAVNHAL